jgi:hypothetical protein
MADINLGVGGANSATGGYEIANSCKFEEDNSEYLERATGGGNGNQSQHTISVWVKRTELTKTSFILGFANIGRLRFESDDKIEYQFRSGRKIETNRLFRDTSAWYHIVVVADSTLATSTDRMKLYVNGVRETDLLTYIPQDLNQGSPAWGVYNTYNYRIGYSGNAGENFNGYIADAYYINGQTLDPTDFGEFDEDSGIWKPKEFTGTLGSLDNYLDFSNSSNLGEDANGGTDLSLNNITSADQATDTPTNNFGTLNLLLPFDEATIFEGSTRVKKTSTNRWRTFVSTQGVLNGKWYAEFQNPLYATTGINRFVGVIPVGNINGSLSATGDFTGGASYIDSFGFYHEGKYWENDSGSVTENTYGSSWANGETIGIALDMDNGYAYFSINGTYQNSGDPTSGATGTGGISLLDTTQAHYIAVSIYNDNADFQCNYGGYTTISISSAASDENGYGTFEYAPPSGYYALCTKNLAEFG